MRAHHVLAVSIACLLPLSSLWHTACASERAGVVTYDTGLHCGFPEGVAWDAETNKFSGGPAVGSKPYVNSIAYNPGGFLIVADYARGKLWRVPLDNPSAFTEVHLPERLKGPDGLLIRSRQELMAVQTFGPRWDYVVAATVPPGISGATTATLRDGEVWFANSHRPALFADPSSKPPLFSLQQANFGESDAVRP